MPVHLDAAHLALGVAAGLTTALCSAVSYLVSRHHGGRAGGPIRLLVLAHLLMGVACIPATALLWPRGLPVARVWLVPLIGCAATYLAGQAVVFAALRRADASRVAPLLGLKIVMLAAITSCLPGGRLDARQWVAVGLSVAAALMLQRGGGGLPPAALASIVAACVAFAISDLFIVGLIDGLQAAAAGAAVPLGRLHAGGLAMTVTYVLCGATALIMLAAPPLRPRNRIVWTGAGQYAVTWLLGMAALYACLGVVGAVFGNILQSTRGIMAIVIGAALAHLGWHDLETRVDAGTLLRRVAAAVLMTSAIAIYVIDLS